MKAKCSMCGVEIRSRRSKHGSAQANLLKAVRKHCWKHHRATMIRKIKAGKAKAAHNPSAQDFIQALQEGPRAALDIYSRYTERQYQHMKNVMDAIEPVLPPVIKASWAAIEAFHDLRKGS